MVLVRAIASASVGGHDDNRVGEKSHVAALTVINLRPESAARC